VKLRWVQREEEKILQQKHLKRWIDIPTIDDYKDSEIEVLASQLARAYVKIKSKYYLKKKIKKILPSQRQFQYFIKAAEIYKTHRVKNFSTFFNAQIKGLKWIQNGQGVFPRPMHLGSQGAEDRLLEYLDSKKKKKHVIVTEKEKQTNLHDNEIYFVRCFKVKDGIADLNETLYVKELQEIRLGRVKDYVKRHLKKLKYRD